MTDKHVCPLNVARPLFAIAAAPTSTMSPKINKVQGKADLLESDGKYEQKGSVGTFW